MNSFQNYVVVFARILLSLMFALSGVDKIAHAEAAAGYMASAGLPGWPALALATGLFEVVAAFALAVGWHTRWAALGLALFTVAANLLFHRYWALAPDQQAMQQLMFTKNLAVAGGMLIVAAFGAGQISVDARRPAARSGA